MKSAANRSIEITPEMVAQMRTTLETKGWTLYRLQKESGVNYKTLLDIFKPKPVQSYRHLSKMEAIYKALDLTLPE